MALITSIGVAGVPSASLVAILIIFKSANIPGLSPEAAMAVLLAVDRLLDMSRTVVNIFSDSCGAVIIGRSEGDEGILQGNDQDVFEKGF
jgi:proton glutamate symport protein